MKRSIVSLALALAVALSVGIAAAEEVTGKVQTVNESERNFTLEDGTQLWLAEGLPPDAVKEGAQVKATFEERDGKKVATSVEKAE